MIEGIDRVRRALDAFARELPATYVGRIERSVNQAGARAAVKHLRNMTPVRTGNLKRSLRVSSRRRRGRRPTRYYSVLGYTIERGRHAHFLEGGTVERFHRTGKSVGRVPARNFFTEGLKSAEPLMLRAMALQARKGFQQQTVKFIKAFKEGRVR